MTKTQIWVFSSASSLIKAFWFHQTGTVRLSKNEKGLMKKKRVLKCVLCLISKHLNLKNRYFIPFDIIQRFMLFVLYVQQPQKA